MNAPVIKVIFSTQPVFGGKCIVVVHNKQSQARLINAIGTLTQNAVDVIGWLSVLFSKTPVIIPNYMFNNQPCTLYLFDPRYVVSSIVRDHLAGPLGLDGSNDSVQLFIGTL